MTGRLAGGGWVTWSVGERWLGDSLLWRSVVVPLFEWRSVLLLLAWLRPDVASLAVGRPVVAPMVGWLVMLLLLAGLRPVMATLAVWRAVLTLLAGLRPVEAP